MDETAIVYVFLILPQLGLIIGALLPVFIPTRCRKLILGLRIAGFVLFAPTVWGFGCISQSGLKCTPTVWQMLTSAVTTCFLYLVAVVLMAVLRWVVKELIAHYTSISRE